MSDKMLVCSACGKEYHESAGGCPQCGKKSPKTIKTIRIAVIIMGAIALALILFTCIILF